ncbi:MAG TPA: magnesium-translocating P-type ATPase [Candidatus Binatia bacterium]|nr:magnesium-translocating P-type ATPase [Candidatus Binatia bacterium]
MKTHRQHKMEALDLKTAMALTPDEVLRKLDSSLAGLTPVEAQARLRKTGPNEIEENKPSWPATLARQFNNPFLLLLVATAVLSLCLHDRSDALIILAIVVLSVGLSFANEFSSETAVADLRARVQRKAVAVRGGKRESVDVAELVPGDVVELAVGDIVPADLRLLDIRELACNEAALTGEAEPAEKSVAAGSAADSGLGCCAYSGTVVTNGVATGVVVATGRSTAIGSIAHKLSERPPQTAFEQGLRSFSLLLVRITVILTVAIFAGNALLHHSLIESLLFALAIAIGITPQLLPAIVTVSLSAGARQIAKKSVIVKRLVSIEDLGNIEILFTDKTGTLTQGKISFRYGVDAGGATAEKILVLGLLCTDVIVEDGRIVSGNALDVALWEAATPEQRQAAGTYRVLDRAPFDYHRQMMSVLVETPDGHRLLLAKGAPEAIEARCPEPDDRFEALTDRELESGNRTIVLAQRDASSLSAISPDDERDFAPIGLLAFADEPKAGAADSLRKLAALGVQLKVVTGDSDRTAQVVCRELGLSVTGVLTGMQLAAMTDAELGGVLDRTTIFARVTPDQKSRIIKLQRAAGKDVGFLGDGVNDAEAIHDADVGISVDSATDVAKDAADIVLLEKDLNILADGVVEGRRIFANTTKYVLMGTSSNFGNMFSAAGASLILPFLPMLPSQILLNNLLYDASEMAIPTDNVDEDQLQRPAHWDMRFIERFMLVFGPISSIFDFLTFWVMLSLFHAGPKLFHTGWFVESLSTQSLVIFLIRTRRVPFFTSHASWQLAVTTSAVVALGIALPFTPLAHVIGFVPLPPRFFVVLGLMIVVYLGLIELGKLLFYKSSAGALPRIFSRGL